MEQDMLIPMTNDGLWHELYEAALLELEPVKLQMRIEAAQAAIQRRMEELIRRNHDGSCLEEKQAIADALNGLRSLQRLEFSASGEPAAEPGSVNQREAGL